MKTYSKQESLGPAPPIQPTHFTGEATGLPVLKGGEGTVNVTMVRFAAGVRNHWHFHRGGQVLHVVDGTGYVQSRGEAARRVAAGDTVSAEAGEEHWHGATEEGPMAHLAISIGETVWLEES